MALSDHQTIGQKLQEAKKEFTQYLQNAAHIEHFLSVTNPDAPLRRMDGRVITNARKRFIGSRFAWNDTNNRWDTIDGRLIPAEHELWSFMARLLVQTDVRSDKKLWQTLKEKTEGLVPHDVRVFLQLWEDHGLDHLGLDLDAVNCEAEQENTVKHAEEDGVASTSASSSNGRSMVSRNEPPLSTVHDSHIEETAGRPTIAADSEEIMSPQPEASPVEIQDPLTDDTHASEVVNSTTDDSHAGEIVNTFHPKYLDFLDIGTSKIDDTTVWFAWRPAPFAKKPGPQFYNSRLESKDKGELRIAWHNHLQLDKFEGKPREKGINRREYCRRVIRENEARILAEAASRKRPPPMRKSRQGRATSRVKTATRKQRLGGESSMQAPAPSTEESAPRERRRTEESSLSTAANSTQASMTRKRHRVEELLTQAPATASGETVARKRRRTEERSLPNPANSSNENVSHETTEKTTQTSAESSKKPASRKRRRAEEAPTESSTNSSDEAPLPPAKRPRGWQDESLRPIPAAGLASHQGQPVATVEEEFSDEPELLSYNAVPQTPALVKPEPLSYAQMAQTYLRVSSSIRPDLAPASVSFQLCPTLDAFFTTMISECELPADGRVSKVSATYTWNGKRHLIRRDRKDDWILFVNAVKKAWAKEGETFVDDGCEVEILVHVD